jgi:hypothetical protein
MTTTVIVKKPTTRTNQKIYRIAASNKNNISFDDSTTSSTNNLSDINSNANDLNDESSETSGRFTATTINSTLPLGGTPPASGSPLQQSNIQYLSQSLKESRMEDKSGSEARLHSDMFIEFLKKKNLNKNIQNDSDVVTNKLDKINRPKKKSSISRKKEAIRSVDNTNKEESSENLSQSEEAGLSLKSTSSTLRSQDSVENNSRLEKIDMDSQNRLNNKSNIALEQIENEIDKLRKENNLLIVNKKAATASKKAAKKNALLKAPASSSSITSTNSAVDEDQLAESSLRASNYFDKKIEHLENYSHIIENATKKMDACVNDMTTVYQSYDKIYNDSSSAHEDILAINEEQPLHTKNSVSKSNKKETANQKEASNVTQMKANPSAYEAQPNTLSSTPIASKNDEQQVIIKKLDEDDSIYGNEDKKAHEANLTTEQQDSKSNQENFEKEQKLDKENNYLAVRSDPNDIKLEIK